MINFLFGLFQSLNALRYTFWLLWRLKVDIWLFLSSLQFTDTYQVFYFSCRLLKIKVSFLEEKGKKYIQRNRLSNPPPLKNYIYCAILWQKWILIFLSSRKRGRLHPMWPSDVSVFTTALWQFTREEFQCTNWGKDMNSTFCRRLTVQGTKWTTTTSLHRLWANKMEGMRGLVHHQPGFAHGCLL